MPKRSAEREQFLADIIIGAIERGTGYWAEVLRYKWQDLAPKDVNAVIVDQEDSDIQRKLIELRDKRGGNLSVNEALDQKLAHKLTIDTIASGIGKIKSGKVPLGSYLKGMVLLGDSENDAGNIDADGADVIVQAAIFDDIVYG